jgi:hypothetical protein
MFVAQDVALEVGYAAARMRLVNLVTGGALADASGPPTRKSSSA